MRQQELPIIFVCDWLPPSFGAVGQYMLKRAELTAERGGDVTLIGLGNESSEITRETGAGKLTIIRIAAPRNAKHNLFQRALWALRADVDLMRATHGAQAKAGPCKILVTGSPPFLSYLLIMQNLLAWRKQVIYRISDFYPETAIAAGKLRWLGLVKPLFRELRRCAHYIEVLGNDQARRLTDDRIESNRIVLHRDNSPVPDWVAAESAQRPFGLEHFVLLYSGNMGVAHEIDTICSAYRHHIMHGANRVRIWINGTGVRIAKFQQYCEAHGLPLHVSPPVLLEQLGAVLRAADGHLILLGENFWGYVLPSKVYASLEAGQPLLYVGPTQSDVHELALQHAKHYWQVAPGDVDACAAALDVMAAFDRAQSPPARRIEFQAQ